MPAYQLSIKLIGDENPLHIQTNVFCFATQHVFSVEGCHAWDKKKTLELNFSLHIKQDTPSKNTQMQIPKSTHQIRINCLSNSLRSTNDK